MKASLSLNEFTNKLKEQQLDLYFSRDDARFLFEHLSNDPADGVVPVVDMARLVSNDITSSRKSDEKLQRLKVADIKHDIGKQLLEHNQRVRIDTEPFTVSLLY